jgi:hypothetical protein
MSYPIIVDLLISTQSKGPIEAFARETDNPKRFRRSGAGEDQGHMPALQTKYNGRRGLVEGEKDRESTVSNDKDMCMCFEGYQDADPYATDPVLSGHKWPCRSLIHKRRRMSFEQSTPSFSLIRRVWAPLMTSDGSDCVLLSTAKEELQATLGERWLCGLCAYRYGPVMAAIGL